ncbi:Cation-independent mannose-6-phosphate receptor CI-MPR [Sarracenia purpurea var. burkii]
MDSQSAFLVITTVVTVSALTVVFSSYSKRKKNAREVSGPIFLAISQQLRGFMNKFIKNQSSGHLDLESNHAVKEMHEKRHAYEDEQVQQQIEGTKLMPEETLIPDPIGSPSSSIINSSVTDSMSSRESEVRGLSSLVLSESGVPQTLPRTKETPKLHFEGYAQETTFASELPGLIAKGQSNAVTCLVKNAHTEVDENTRPFCKSGDVGEGYAQETEFASELPALIAKAQSSAASRLVKKVYTGGDEHTRPFCESGEVGEIISYGGILRESGREGLYTFYDANRSEAKSLSKLNGLKTLSSRTSLQVKFRFSSLTRKSTTNGMTLSVQDSIHIAENEFVSSESVEGKIPLACYKELSPAKSTDMGKRKSFHREERRTLPQDGCGYSPEFSHSNGMEANDKHHPSQQISTYNHLLKNGRLLDCLDLLEDMERKGLLDMDKVYHVRFFKNCQRQRAVKEAFRFTKLIPNPTLSTFNMLMSVCACCQDSEGAFVVMQLVQDAGLKADCKLYTTLISTCAKSGKVDAMFKVFHEMVNAGVEPNVHTYGALIDGCAKAGQVAKAFGAYGIMRSKKVKPDRVVFNALITACGQSGAIDRAFDVLAEMSAEVQPVDPDHITIGALIKACANAGQIDRARQVYNMIHQYNIKGTPEVYTIAVNSCSQTGDWEFACIVYSDMTRKGVIPDEVFLSTLDWKHKMEVVHLL